MKFNGWNDWNGWNHWNFFVPNVSKRSGRSKVIK
jgi:hypothetical protein